MLLLKHHWSWSAKAADIEHERDRLLLNATVPKVGRTPCSCPGRNVRASRRRPRFRSTVRSFQKNRSSWLKLNDLIVGTGGV